MARPFLKIRLFNSETKKSVDVGVAWIHEATGSLSFKFERTTDLKAQYPTMRIEDAMKKVDQGAPYYLNGWPGERDVEFATKPKGQSAVEAEPDPAAEFGDDDLLF